MNFSFMKLKWGALLFSFLGIVSALYYTLGIQGGFNESIDFAGGINLEIQKNTNVTLESVKEFIAKEKIKGKVQMAGKGVKELVKLEINGNEEIRLTKLAEKNAAELEKNEMAINSVDYVRYRMISTIGNNNPDTIRFINAAHVGPTVGAYLRVAAMKVLGIALILIAIYVAFRFRVNFAAGATMALLHDLLFTSGIIGIMQIPLSVPVIAALLTILGYSINDTIVIFDRIRENMHGSIDATLDRTVDRSIWQSMSRTINTTLTTLMAIVPVYLFGGEGLKEMAQVLIIGVIIGTYSSNFIASPILVLWDRYISRKRN